MSISKIRHYQGEASVLDLGEKSPGNPGSEYHLWVTSDLGYMAADLDKLYSVKTLEFTHRFVISLLSFLFWFPLEIPRDKRTDDLDWKLIERDRGEFSRVYSLIITKQRRRWANPRAPTPFLWLVSGALWSAAGGKRNCGIWLLFPS